MQVLEENQIQMKHINLVVILLITIGVAWFTVLERKVLSYSQLRKGPNKATSIGFFIPLLDAGKLIFKNLNYYNISGAIWPVSVLFIALMTVVVVFSEIPNQVVLFLIFIRVIVFPTFWTGWFRERWYALLGSIRAIAQRIRYEVCLRLILLRAALSTQSFALHTINYSVWSIWVCLLLIVWISLAETNRRPFDFVEGESELVSGFNVEYAGLSFAVLFLGEYIIIITYSYLIGGLEFVVAYICLYIIIRACLPRFRYDLLISLRWNICLPMSIMITFLIFIPF